jgi:hypothetical protein
MAPQPIAAARGHRLKREAEGRAGALRPPPAPGIPAVAVAVAPAATYGAADGRGEAADGGAALPVVSGPPSR